MSAPARRTMKNFLDSILFSYAQILFSNRRWFGGVLLATTFFRYELGLLGLAGVAISNLTAYALKFDSERIRSGFYGFNGVLFGVIYAHFFEPSLFLLSLFPIFVIITFLITAVLENHLATMYNLPGLSLPFLLGLYITIVFLWNYDFAVYRTVLSETAMTSAILPQGIYDYFQSLSLIFLQFNVWSGAAIAAALLLFSRTAFVLSAAGFAANMMFFGWLMPHRPDMLLVLSGLNAILTALALGGSLVIPSRKSFFLALAAVLMVVVFTGFFGQISVRAGLPVLVLPFNAVVLTTLYSLKFRQKSSGLVLLYFKPGAPEENYYYHHTSRARFEKHQELMADLPFLGRWLVSQGHEGDVTHKQDWKYAWDFVGADDAGRTYQDSGKELEDYYCYRLPVTAPLDGEVATVIDRIPNNPVGEVNLAQNWGNTIILKHADTLYSALSHLDPGSALVEVGDSVERGQILALCGNSGRSPEPHLHFQFQETDKLGDKTFEYPIGYFIEESDEVGALRTADHPKEGTTVQNLSDHRGLRDAFGLKLGDEFEFRCRSGKGAEQREQWEVKVDILNTVFIKSSAGAWVNVFVNDRVFYLTAFRGNRKSALYHFYLCALQAPLGFWGGLAWRDEYPLDRVDRSWSRYISELLLLAGVRPQARAEFRFRERVNGSDEIVIENSISIRGLRASKAPRREGRGSVTVSASGEIESFRFAWDGGAEFEAERDEG